MSGEGNESLLQAGECQTPNCIEPIGHDGSHSMTEDWTKKWLTEGERRSSVDHFIKGIKACPCGECKMARSLAASRALLPAMIEEHEQGLACNSKTCPFSLAKDYLREAGELGVK